MNTERVSGMPRVTQQARAEPDHMQPTACCQDLCSLCLLQYFSSKGVANKHLPMHIRHMFKHLLALSR